MFSYLYASILIPYNRYKRLLKTNVQLPVINNTRNIIVFRRARVFHEKRDFTSECAALEADVFSFQRLSSLYPGQFSFLRYEDICQDPIGKTECDNI